MKNIYSYPDYLILNESRAEIIDPKGISFNPYIDVLKQPKEILEKYAPWYNPVEIGTPLLRNVSRKNYDEYLLIDPKEKRRGTKKGFSSSRNYINMIVDEEWKGFPNRGNSIIGTANKANKNLYGEMTYRVIPIKSNSEIAISPSQDFWFSFDFDDMWAELGNTNVIGTISTKEIDEVMYKNIKLKKSYDSIREFKNDLNTNNALKTIEKDFNAIKELKQIEDKYGSIYNFLTFYISPGNGMNGKYNREEFKTINYNKSTIIDGEKEFWTNSACLLIKEKWESQGTLNDVYLRS